MVSFSIDQVVGECRRNLNRGDHVRAMAIARELKRQAPNEPRARLLEGIVATRFGQAEEAIRLLEQATFELEGDDLRQATMTLARARVLAGDIAGALATIDPIAGEQDPPPEALAIKASALIASSRLDECDGLLAEADTEGDEAHHTAIALGRLALATPAGDDALPRREESAAEALSAQSERVGVPAVYLTEVLSLLGELRARRGGSDEDAAHLFRRSAGLNPNRYDPRPYAKSVVDMLATWNAKTVPRARRLDTATERPVFIVGMPGGGPELAGSLLEAHPAVSRTGDVEALPAAVSWAIARNGGKPTGVVNDPSKLSGKVLTDAAERYLEQTDPYNEAISRVIDVNPLNLHVLGVVAQMLPNARVVLVRRDPFDACFGCFLRHADPRLLYAHDPRAVVLFATVLKQLEEHWMTVFSGEHLPLRTSTIDYADLLAGGPAASGLFEFAGLDPIDPETIGRITAEHGRWTGHRTGLHERFAASMPELVESIRQAGLGAV